MQAVMQRHARLRLPLFALGALVTLTLAVGCDDDDDDDRTDAGGVVTDGGPEVEDDAGMVPERDGAVADVSEAEIAAVVSAINAGEIAHAMLAEDRAVRADVQAFAEAMIEAHTTAQAEHTDLLMDMGVTPAESALSSMVENQSMTLAKKLAELSGEEFDAAYIDAQIITHAEALDILQTRLMPNAETTRYRQFLVELRDAIVGHLQDARAIDEEIGGPVMPAP